MRLRGLGGLGHLGRLGFLAHLDITRNPATRFDLDRLVEDLPRYLAGGADDELKGYVALLYGQARLLMGDKPEDPAAFAQALNNLMVNNAQEQSETKTKAKAKPKTKPKAKAKPKKAKKANKEKQD